MEVRIEGKSSRQSTIDVLSETIKSSLKVLNEKEL